MVIFNSTCRKKNTYVLNRTWDMDTQHSERVKFRETNYE